MKQLSIENELLKLRAVDLEKMSNTTDVNQEQLAKYTKLENEYQYMSIILINKGISEFKLFLIKIINKKKFKNKNQINY